MVQMRSICVAIEWLNVGCKEEKITSSSQALNVPFMFTRRVSVAPSTCSTCRPLNAWVAGFSHAHAKVHIVV